MNYLLRICLVAAVCFLLDSLARSGQAQEWSEFRGRDGVGRIDSDGILASPQKIGLKIRWKRKLGSGYSSVILADDNVIAMYCDEENDLIGCFRQADGEKVWSVAIGKKFKGENGSFDGPISTPLYRDAAVYCLSPRGDLFKLSLEDGKTIWKRDLAAKDKARKPLYGFATSPILVGNTLIVQTGGLEGALAGFDAESGEPLWSCTTGPVDSQSPALLDVGGRPIVLAASGKHLFGVDPANGKVMLEHEHGGSNGSAMVPVVFQNENVLMTLDDGFSTAVTVREVDGNFTVSELWKSRSIKNTYNVPVEFGDHLYAYSTRILTCVDSKTGKATWKSRKPGDGFLIVVDGHVILNTKQGSLHVLKASEGKFDEVAGAKIFDDLVWSLPAYHNNAVYLRSLGELACVDLVSSATEAVATSETNVGPKFAKMIAEAGESANPQEVVDKFLGEEDSFPYVEGKLAHFIYQGEADDVAVAGDMFGARQERKMQRIDNTNTWYCATALPEDVRLNYIFLVDFKPSLDPRNPRKTISSIYAGEMEFAVRLRNEEPLAMSWFGMPRWKDPGFTRPAGLLRGKLIEKEVPSEMLGKPHKIEIYLPPRYNDGDQRFPVVYVFGGTNAKQRGRLHEIVDNLDGSGKMEPAILVYFDGLPLPNFPEAIAKEVVPFVDEEFRTIADRRSRLCISNGLGASISLMLVAQQGDVFGGACVQTPLIFDQGQQQAIDSMKRLKLPTVIYLDWGMYDMFNPDENWDARKIGKRLFNEFSQAEKVTLVGGEVPDSSDWASWRNRFDRVLSMFDKMKGLGE